MSSFRQFCLPLLTVRIIWLLYAAGLFLSTHLPVPESLEEIVGMFDKVFHANAFFVLGLLTLVSLCWDPRETPALRRPSLAILAGLLLYAGLDEWLQGFTNRTPDLSDWCSDACGIVLAWLAMFTGARKPPGESVPPLPADPGSPGNREDLPS